MPQTITGTSGQLHPYIQTLRSHRLLFALPVVVAAVMATWFVLGSPKQYESGTSLWVDTAPSTDVTPAQPTDNTGTVIPPAAQAQTLLNELLSTRHFRTQVGHESPLATYLAHHTSKGWSPTALLGSLRGTPALENRIVDALGSKGVSSKVVGPQVLTITLHAGDPTVAAKTLAVLLTEFDKEARSTRTARGQAAVAYYKDQVAGAQERLSAAHQQVDDYLAQHPGVKPCSSPSAGTAGTAASSGCSDLRLRALTDADRAAAARLVDATGNLNQAQINLQALPAAGSAFRVVDPPRVPVGPVAGIKKAVLGVFAGLFAGVLASALGVVGVTSLQRAIRPVGVDTAGDETLADEPAAAPRRPIEIEVFSGEEAPPPPAPPGPEPAAAKVEAPKPAAAEVEAPSIATPEIETPEVETPNAESEESPAPTAEAPVAEIVEAGAPAAEHAEEAEPAATGTTRVAASVADAEPAAKPTLAVVGGDGRSAADEMAWEAGPPPPAGAEALAPVPAHSNGHTAAEATADSAEPARPAGRRARRASNASANGHAGRGESDDDGPPATTPPAAEDEHPAAARPARKAGAAAGHGRRGFTGTVIRVRVDGAGPKAHAVWSIRQPADGAQPKPGARIHVERPPGYGGLVRALRDDHDGAHIFEVEITATRPAPGTPEEHAIPATDPRWLGTEVSFAPGSATSARTPTRRRSPSPL